MNARRAQLEMLAIEMHEQDFNIEQYLTWLCQLDNEPEETGRVVSEELQRAKSLADNHYARVSDRLTVMNPLAIMAIGFQQGATFAAAALGRPPFSAGEAHEHGEQRE